MDLDGMLKQLGQFGCYQMLCFTVLLLPAMFAGFRSTEFIFTTMSIPHRCRVPECETLTAAEFNTPWLQAALPVTKHGTDLVPQECLRYRPLLTSVSANQTVCSAEMFNRSETITCTDWVFSEPTRTLAMDFNILCPEDRWKLTLLGSFFVIPSIIGRPLAGILSDRFGRRTVMVIGCTVLAVTGVLRSFSVSYTMSLALECLDGVFIGFVFTSTFILGLEILAPGRRLLGSLLIHVYFAVGEVALALAMWALADWRLMLRALYVPSLALVAMHWLLPESLRWLKSQEKLDDIEKVFKRIAKMNKTEDKLPEVLSQLHKGKICDKSLNSFGNPEKPSSPSSLKEVLKSRTVLLRLVAFQFCWMAALFTYYGISQFSTMFESSNRYVTFLFVSLVEVPAHAAGAVLSDWQLLGRRGTTAWSFLLCGATCLMLPFIPNNQVVLTLAMFVTSKFAATLSLSVLYLYTAEVFPTALRHTLLGICSMVGRLGAVASQQAPLISYYFDPNLLFSTVAVVGGIITLKLPETLNTTLPDTIEEAEMLGKPQSQPKCPASPNDQIYCSRL